MKYVLTIPGRLPDLNDMTNAARANKFASAAMKKEYTVMVAWIVKAARIPQMEKIDLIFTWFEPNKKRDKDNIMAGQKFVLDGLVVGGAIKNDGWAQIGDVLHKIRLDRDNPRIEVEIKEAEG